MNAPDSPAWRRAFNGVERRVSPPLATATSSPNVQVAASVLDRARRTVLSPVDGVLSWGLHLAGLPSHADVRDLKRQLGEVQREVLALRRDLHASERDRQDPQ